MMPEPAPPSPPPPNPPYIMFLILIILILLFPLIIALVLRMMRSEMKIERERERMTGRAAARIAKRLREWFMGYDDAPLWLCFCRFIFWVSSLACILSFCGPAILVGDPIDFMAYQEWVQTDISLFYIYIVVVLVTFTLAVISGIPTILYEKKKMEKSNELANQ